MTDNGGGYRPVVARFRRWAGSLPVRVSVSLLLLGWLLVDRVDLARLLEVSAALAPMPLLIAMAALVLGRMFVALRWQLVLGRSARDVSFRELLRVVYVSEGVGALAPGNLLIEGMRVFAISSRTGAAAAVGSVVVERVFALAVMAGAGGIGVLFAELPLGTELRYGLAALLLAPALAMPGLLLLRLPAFEPVENMRGIVGLLRRIVVDLLLLARPPRLLFAVLGLTVAMQGIRILQTWLLALALGLSLDPFLILILGPVGFFIGLLPVSMMGLGVREVSFVSLLALVGVGEELAVLLGLLHVAVFLPAIVLPGLVIYVLSGVRLEQRARPSRPVVRK